MSLKLLVINIRLNYNYKHKLEDRLRRQSIDVNAFTTSTACCDLDLSPPESNQVIIVSFVETVQGVHEIYW